MRPGWMPGKKPGEKGWKNPLVPLFGTSLFFVDMSVVFGFLDMGLSENSVPPHPMVNDHYPY